MATLMPGGKQTYFDNAGDPLAGGLLYTYAAGTSTPLATYSNKAGTTPNANPVVLDARGEATIFWGAASYKVSLHTAADVELWTQDDVDPSAVVSGYAPLASPAFTGTPTGLGPAPVTATGSTTGRSLAARFADVLNVKDFGTVGDGVTDDAAAIQAAIDAATAAGGGIVFAPRGDYLIAGAAFINIKANVLLRGVGPGTRFISGTGGQAAHHAFVYLKDGAAIEDCRLSGSNYEKQSGGANYIGYNKIAITTQGAVTGSGFRASRVGFEKFLNSCLYVHDGHSNAIQEDCYSFGQQPGTYVDVDANGLVTGWNATQDAGRLAAGTQVYSLTNTFNTGTAAHGIIIRGGQWLNINDAFIGINAGSYDITITDNDFVKDAAGYYGGWGLDVAAGVNVRASKNHIKGSSYGAHLGGGSHECTLADNIFETASGVWIDGSSLDNAVVANIIDITAFTGLSNLYGINVQTATANELIANTILGHSIAGVKGIYFQGTTSANRSLLNKIKDCATGVESADANNDGNFSYLERFSTVTTPYPRAINSNLFSSVKGISGTTANANNLSGSTSIAGTDTSVAVTFTNAEPDTNYRIIPGVAGFSGTPAAGAFTITGETSRATSGFTLNVSAAPGVGNQVNFNWMLMR